MTWLWRAICCHFGRHTFGYVAKQGTTEDLICCRYCRRKYVERLW